MVVSLVLFYIFLSVVISFCWIFIFNVLPSAIPVRRKFYYAIVGGAGFAALHIFGFYSLFCLSILICRSFLELELILNLDWWELVCGQFVNQFRCLMLSLWFCYMRCNLVLNFLFLVSLCSIFRYCIQTLLNLVIRKVHQFL